MARVLIVEARFYGHLNNMLLMGARRALSAAERMAEGIADGISFGRPFISNPDLVHRLAVGARLAPGDTDSFYAGGPAGYVDYPPLDEAKAA